MLDTPAQPRPFSFEPSNKNGKQRENGNKMTEPTDDQPTLPGLELGELRGPLREAVVTTLTELREAGLLEPRHAALGQLALTLADAVERGTYSGKASAAAMAAGQLRETLLALPAPLEADAAERFNRFVAALEAEANA